MAGVAGGSVDITTCSTVLFMPTAWAIPHDAGLPFLILLQERNLLQMLSTKTTSAVSEHQETPPVIRSFILAVAAGIFIGIGGTVLLSLENRIIGAVLFSVALLSICMLGLYLFTGKVGYLVDSHTRQDIFCVFAGLFGNAFGCWLAATGVRLCCPAVDATVQTMVSAKLQQTWYHSVVAGIFCGILMYTAVHIFREKSSVFGIFFCVPVFILSGFEHSIADMFYFFCAGVYSAAGFRFLLLVVLGNTIGGCLVPFLTRLAYGKNNAK